MSPFIKKYARLKITTIAGTCFMFYLGWNLIYADKGILSLKAKQGEVIRLTKELKELKIKKAQLYHRVNLLYPQTFDLDLLEEQSVKVLGYSHPTDLIILKDIKSDTLK